MGNTIYLGKVDEVIPNFINPINESDLISDEIIPFGKNNLFPEEMTSLCRQSAYLRGVINSKVTYCGGVEFVSKDIIEHSEFQNLLLDSFESGNAYIEVVTDKKKSFVKLFHQDTTKPRKAVKFKGFILNPDWEHRDDTLDVKIPLYPDFKLGEDGLYHALIHIKNYEPGFKHYGVPSNYAGMKAAIIDSQADRWNKERLENNFGKDGILIIPGVDTTDEAKLIKKDLDAKSGAKLAGGLMPIFQKTLQQGQTKEKPELIGLNDNDDGSWLNLDDKAREKILIANGWKASLAAFPESTGFDTDRILNDYKIVKKNVIDPIQKKWMDLLTKIYSDFGIAADVTILNNAPIDEMDNEVLTINERREMQGKDPIQGGDVLLSNQSKTAPNGNI